MAKRIINQIITDKDIVYQDSIGRFAIHIMHEGLWYPQSHMFYKESADSVIFTENGTGKPTAMSRAKGNSLVFKDKGGRMRPVGLDSMVMSVAEMKYVNDEIDKMVNYKWYDHLFLDSRMISTDTVNAVFKDWKGRGWNYMYKMGIHKLYTFSKPILLRNGTFCLFYYGYSCGGLCGYGEFALYKNENGKWVRWVAISSWIS
ncbi:hypothetical protein ACFS5N_15180 [Mucilaginibacter ximonensis]|uniref:Uncharacterized protein n=1 Tax=Mucilaginibacter ximonensis TaxID=538021 RepID=A0ABW5YG72_9SPHI